MVFKRFSVVVFTRAVLLCLTAFTLIYLLTKTSFIATPFIVAVLTVLQIYLLVHYVQKTNRDIARFFDSIRYSDFSQTFRSNVKGSSFEDLNRAFAEVIEAFRKTRAEKEEQYRYFQIVVQHVGIGLMAFTADGQVGLLNAAAKRLLKVNGLQNISEISALNKRLVETLQNIAAGQNILVKFVNDNELFQLSIYATEFKMRDSHYKLVSLANIQSELEESEMQAWQNLIRVLTHEIMNSVTPIISLSSTAGSLLQELMNGGSEGKPGIAGRKEEVSETNSSSLSDVKGALDTISRRSQGLLHFVDDYRNLTRIPAPNFQTFKVTELFGRVQKLFSDRFQVRNIKFTCAVEPADLELTADPDLVEQVIINLITNSISAISAKASPEIRLTSRMDSRAGILIQVADNGQGIPEELQDKIFIPFFTTRKEGSGIGLSLSRQIMRAHKGGIAVSSAPGQETVFTLRF
jgi:signal transduction histidine kinase